MSDFIAEHLLPLLRKRFPGRPMKVGDASVVFPAAHPEVGDLEIHDNNEELVVSIGQFTHEHFMNTDRRLTRAQARERIVESVLRFLEDVFADRIEFFGDRRGKGGWRPRKDKPRGFISKRLLGETTYVWSGPLR